MDGIYRFQRHIYDVTRRYYLLGRDQLLNDLAVPEGGSVLEIGCGTGRNLIAAAKRYPSAKLYGLDISEEMLKSALSKVMRFGLQKRALLAQADATNFSAQNAFGHAKFDRVFFSYTLSMIPNWQAALDQALACVADNGELHIVDFSQCERLPRLFRRGLFIWLNLFHVHPRKQLLAHVRRLATATGRQVSFESKFRDYALLIKLTSKV